MNKTNFLTVIKRIFYYALLLAGSGFVSFKIGHYLEKQKENCKLLEEEDHYKKRCHIYLDPYLPNITIFLGTFVSTIIYYTLLYLLFGYIV